MRRQSKKVSTLKQRNWYQWKAKQLRDSWRGRAKKYNLKVEDVPTRVQIQEWLEIQPLFCYLTETPIKRDDIEADHKVPLIRDGALTLDNIGLTSRFYNNVKGQLTEKEFRQLLNLIKYWPDKGEHLLKRLSTASVIYKRKYR